VKNATLRTRARARQARVALTPPSGCFLLHSWDALLRYQSAGRFGSRGRLLSSPRWRGPRALPARGRPAVGPEPFARGGARAALAARALASSALLTLGCLTKLPALPRISPWRGAAHRSVAGQPRFARPGRRPALLSGFAGGRSSAAGERGALGRWGVASPGTAPESWIGGALTMARARLPERGLFLLQLKVAAHLLSLSSPRERDLVGVGGSRSSIFCRSSSMWTAKMLRLALPLRYCAEKAWTHA
jgi:hypothetical protein